MSMQNVKMKQTEIEALIAKRRALADEIERLTLELEALRMDEPEFERRLGGESHDGNTVTDVTMIRKIAA